MSEQNPIIAFSNHNDTSVNGIASWSKVHARLLVPPVTLLLPFAGREAPPTPFRCPLLRLLLPAVTWLDELPERCPRRPASSFRISPTGSFVSESRATNDWLTIQIDQRGVWSLRLCSLLTNRLGGCVVDQDCTSIARSPCGTAPSRIG